MSLFQGKYKPKNPEKYMNKEGLNNICFRSSWEKAVMIFLDNNPNVLKWGSEEIQIPYINENDGNIHRYFLDFYIEFTNGKKIIVEVKPYSQTQAPQKIPGKKLVRYIEECKTFIKNMSKWKYAKRWAQENGMKFQIWTERDLQKLGINLITSKKFKYINYAKKKTSHSNRKHTSKNIK